MRRIICVALILTVSVILIPGGGWAKSWNRPGAESHPGSKGIEKVEHGKPPFFLAILFILRRISALEDDVSALQTQVVGLEDAVSKQDSDMDAVKKTISTLEEKLVAAEATISGLEKKLAAAEQTISILEGELTLARDDIDDLDTRLVVAETSLENVKPLLALGDYMSMENETISGLSGPHVIFTGANVHVRSGSDSTDDGGNPSGLGNLILGYNEAPNGLVDGDRAGSHNLIVGPNHRFSSYGGFIAGFTNTVNGPYSTVSGGENNTASEYCSSVSGGYSNTASEYCSTVNGGRQNAATGFYSTVSGGGGNKASGFYSSISGGKSNTASGISASVSGGAFNTAGGEASSTSGGNGRGAWDKDDWRAGTLLEDQ